MNPNFYVHETSIVEPGAVIGAGTKIWHFCHVMHKLIFINDKTNDIAIVIM
jgi:acyl-[acyl carrier protein]--UDP-N-acetylglucosamine O-acyltransferase